MTEQPCPWCGGDIAPQIALAFAEATSRAGKASAAGMTKKQRQDRARAASAANLARSKKSKALTRAKQSEAAKAMWARRKDPLRGDILFSVRFVDSKAEGG